MTYQEATEYLFCKTSNFEHQGAGGYKEGLENTLKLDEHSVIHTSTIAVSTLQEQTARAPCQTCWLPSCRHAATK